MPTRAEVYTALDSERAYQEFRWNKNTTTSGGQHSFTEWVAYMDYYLGLAKKELATRARQEAYPDVAHIMRKVTAMGVAAMEQLGAPKREGF